MNNVSKEEIKKLLIEIKKEIKKSIYQQTKYIYFEYSEKHLKPLLDTLNDQYSSSEIPLDYDLYIVYIMKKAIQDLINEKS